MTITATALSSVVRELVERLGPGATLTGVDLPVRNHNDYSGMLPSRPLAVVHPSGTEGISTVLRLCNAHGIAVVPQEGLTGLCGGARAVEDPIALSMERLVGIEDTVAFLPGIAEQPKDDVEEVVCELVRVYQGTASAEHGIGTLKQRWLGHARTLEEIALMRTLKTALDPKNLLNPGKVV